MSGDKKAERLPVSSVGNSWIVAHSKSHPGHVYYFNTFTGEAVWNLSEAETERARMRTKILEPNSIPAKCPEPKNNPPPPNILHQERQIPNNVNQEYQTVSTYSDMAVTGLSPFNFNDMNKQIKSFNIISTPAVFNHSPWAVPPPQQFFITPSIPIVNQGQALNVEYGHVLHNSQPGVSGYKAFHMPHRGRGRFQNRKNFGRGGHFQRFKKPLQMNDLRQRLALRKRLRNNTYQTEEFYNPESTYESNKESGPNYEGMNLKTADIGAHIASMIEEVLNTREFKDEVDTRENNVQAEENVSPLDVSQLKCSAPSKANPDNWYIVVDYEVLLEEFELLNRIMNSDDTCCLSVPDNVLTELKDYIAASNNIPARRIFQSLMQKVDIGSVILGQKVTQDSGASISNPILKTCFDLMEDNNHVILLTNDSALLNYKKFIKVNMMTIDEIKILLEGLDEDQPKPILPTVSPVQSPPIKSAIQLDAIKITIPGNQSSEIETMTEDEPNVDTVCDKELTENANSQPVEVNLPPNCAIDADIQTDMVTLTSNDVKKDDRDALANKTQARNTRLEILDSNKSETTQKSGVVMPPFKRREIKLKRSVSHQPVTSNSLDKGNEKKPFRWRSRKRLANCQESASNIHPTNSHDSTNVVYIHTNTTNDILNNETVNERNLNSDEITESRESSVVCTSAKKDSIVIEGTSTSGISNTESNIDVHSELTENQCLESNECSVRIDSEFMEESLRTKCEEWVSRYIQIMEEVLAVVLHKEPSFSNVEMPPPWTVHEAAQCIRKYTNVPSVRRASDKLSGILFRLSDSFGKITTNMTAQQYMEMYDSGVSMLTALKNVIKCEDVEIAEESLRKLLIDIKNPYYDSNDSVIDRQEKLQIPEELNDSAQHTSLLEAIQDDTTSKQRKYNLRSKSQKSIEPPQPVKIIRNVDIKSSFLLNFNLKKTNINQTQSNTLFNRSQEHSNERPCITFSSNSNNAIIPTSKATIAPNIVRNFTKCPAFEERLRKKLEQNAFEDDDEYLDYDEEQDDYMNTGDGDLEDINMSDEEELQSDPNATQLFEASDLDISAKLVTSSPKAVDPSLAKESNNRFKYMMGMFLKEVRNAINKVKVLCDKCYAELNNPQLPPTQRNELRIQIENAHLHIVGLCISLESMLDRDPNAPTDNIQTVLKKAGINVSHVDERLLSSYWDTIANCKKHADVFLFSVRDIIAGLKSLSA